MCTAVREVDSSQARVGREGLHDAFVARVRGRVAHVVQLGKRTDNRSWTGWNQGEERVNTPVVVRNKHVEQDSGAFVAATFVTTGTKQANTRTQHTPDVVFHEVEQLQRGRPQPSLAKLRGQTETLHTNT